MRDWAYASAADTVRALASRQLSSLELTQAVIARVERFDPALNALPVRDFERALAAARDHGLPVARYDVAALTAMLRAAQTEGDRGRAEVAMTRAYLAWAHDLTSGALTPKQVDAGIVREINVIDPQVLLSRIAKGDPEAMTAALEEGADFVGLVAAVAVGYAFFK